MGVDSGRPDDIQVAQVAHVNEGGQPEKAGQTPGVVAGGKNEVATGLNGSDGRSTPGPHSDSSAPEWLGATDGAKPVSTDDLDKRLHGGLEECTLSSAPPHCNAMVVGSDTRVPIDLQLFFGTTELAKDEDDAIRPNAG